MQNKNSIIFLKNLSILQQCIILIKCGIKFSNQFNFIEFNFTNYSISIKTRKNPNLTNLYSLCHQNHNEKLELFLNNFGFFKTQHIKIKNNRPYFIHEFNPNNINQNFIDHMENTINQKQHQSLLNICKQEKQFFGLITKSNDPNQIIKCIPLNFQIMNFKNSRKIQAKKQNLINEINNLEYKNTPLSPPLTKLKSTSIETIYHSLHHSQDITSI